MPKKLERRYDGEGNIPTLTIRRVGHPAAWVGPRASFRVVPLRRAESGTHRSFKDGPPAWPKKVSSGRFEDAPRSQTGHPSAALRTSGAPVKPKARTWATRRARSALYANVARRAKDFVWTKVQEKGRLHFSRFEDAFAANLRKRRRSKQTQREAVATSGGERFAPPVPVPEKYTPIQSDVQEKAK
jgi:hypothetical protein